MGVGFASISGFIVALPVGSMHVSANIKTKDCDFPALYFDIEDEPLVLRARPESNILKRRFPCELTAASQSAKSDSPTHTCQPMPAIYRGPTLFLLLVFLTSGILRADEAEIDFNRDIRPIVSGVCVACHGPDESAREAGLRLDARKDAIADLGGYAAIVPGDADASELLARITTEDEDLRMPPPQHGPRLAAEKIDLLRRWINSGAEYAKHWAYVPPRRTDLPMFQNLDWPNGPIDRFILAKLERQGLAPSKPADRHAIARRVALSLTGLPPSQQELADFVSDPLPDAYERYVDSQLCKPAFGERWARVWLDIARYADSAGYADDPPRTIWAYRDYVIRSLNQNKPFDQFTIEQLAGDLLENPSEQQLVATAFHRNTMTNNEGGTNDEQFRNEAIVDRVNTTFAVWMGTTMACAQCHTHKYDPITQEEYFQVFDIFNQTMDADRRDESPTIELWAEKQLRRKEELQASLTQLQQKLDLQTPRLDEALENWLANLIQPPTWQAIVPNSVASNNGTLETEESGTVRLIDQPPATAIYELSYPLGESSNVSAIQLQVAPTQDANFVLSHIAAHFVPEQATSISARYVRIVLPGKNRFLHVAEVEAYEAGKNVATSGKATQVSTAYGAEAGRAIDGNTEGDFYKESVTHTADGNDPWLEIDLGRIAALDKIVVWNRLDGGDAIQNRIEGYEIQLLDEEHTVIETLRPKTPLPSAEIGLTGTRHLRFVDALADFSQPNFPAKSVITDLPADANPSAETGWAIGGSVGQAHALTLLLDAPAKLGKGTLHLRLMQTSKFSAHVIKEFRLATTADSGISNWVTIPNDIRELVSKQQWSGEEKNRLATYHRSVTPLLEEARVKLAEVQQSLADLKPETSVPVLRDLPTEKQRKTYVQLRGNYQSLGKQVSSGVPDIFHQRAGEGALDRLDFAKWLVDSNNPLTARVVVNRHWEQIFGTGIVETSEEFGSQGDFPSHPEMLDWLAIDLVESDWDLKALLKQMVMSITYRQSSEVSPQYLVIDSDNRYYARGPRFRISAEMVRDQSLFVAGLLSDKMYGPPVRPPRPQLGLSAAFGSGTDWQTSAGEDRYRRGIYTTWRRSNPYPSMATFDAPNREVCTLRRSRTNTPLQALVTMNDPVFVEAAQGLARRMAVLDSSMRPTISEQIAAGFELTLMRKATAAETQRLAELYETLVQHYQADLEAANQIAQEPLGPLPQHADPAEMAALTVVANVLLNLDEFLMPR